MVTKTIPIEGCPSFTGCSSPLCPLADNLEYCVFYADEPICTSRKFRQPWVRIQKRIARRTKCNVDAGYFTVKMLQSITRVTPFIKGINPKFDASEENWVGGRTKDSADSSQAESVIPAMAKGLVGGGRPQDRAKQGQGVLL